jgi:NO-binding membrane sensor protein with MHYT domain
VAEIHHLTHGVVSPVVAYLISFLGSLLGLVCTTRAREARTRRRRARWLVLAAVSIGGAAIWLMHFTAMLGFDVPESPVRYDPFLTAASLVIAIATVGGGVFIAGHGRRSSARIAGGGLLTGCGVLAMHYTGMAAVRVAGRIEYDTGLVAASAVIAVVAATVALWFTVTIRGWRAIVIASGIMGVAVCGMHYTGMAAMRVRLWPIGEGRVEGINPSLLVVPITLLTSTALVAAALSALQAMTEEEFTDPVTPRVGRHATVALDLGRIRAHRDRLTPIRPRTSWEDELNTGERWV